MAENEMATAPVKSAGKAKRATPSPVRWVFIFFISVDITAVGVNGQFCGGVSVKIYLNIYLKWAIVEL